MDFHDFFLHFTQDRNTHHVQGIACGSPEIIYFHHMEKLIRDTLLLLLILMQSKLWKYLPQIFTQICNMFFPSTKMFLMHPRVYLHLVENMTMPLFYFSEFNSPIPVLTTDLFHRRMKLKKSFRNYCPLVLSILALVVIIFQWIW